MILTYIHPAYQDTVFNSVLTDTINVVKVQNNTVPVSRLKSTAAKEKLQLPSREGPVFEHKPVKGENWNSSVNFFLHNGLTGIVSGVNKKAAVVSSLQTGKARPSGIMPTQRNSFSHDWLLGIFLLLVLLFVWIRIFYSKIFASLASALSSFQLSSKLFQERNVLHQRVSIVLDFIYVAVFSVFLFEYIEYTGSTKTGMSGMKLFLLLLNIMLLYTLFRIGILRLTGSLFMSRRLFAEYIHNTFVVNKGMGIALFPVIIMAQYMPHQIIPVILFIGIAVFIIAFLLKSLRAYQIIMRRDILLFYLILYLCTLEILPLLLGYKFVTSLIQSN